jgi:hypothetical protein
MEVVLIRHAQPDVAPGICYGALDLKLAQPVVRRRSGSYACSTICRPHVW